MIRDFPRQIILTELRSFLGLVQFFRRFIQEFSKIAAPLTNLTRKHSNVANWNPKCNSSFSCLKTSLVTSPAMWAPGCGRPFRCHTDASQVAVGDRSLRLTRMVSMCFHFDLKDCQAQKETTLLMTANYWDWYTFYYDSTAT